MFFLHGNEVFETQEDLIFLEARARKRLELGTNSGADHVGICREQSRLLILLTN